jgi:predicted PurR-regulated permease PerM
MSDNSIESTSEPSPTSESPTQSKSSAKRQAVLSAFGPGGWGRRFAKLWGFLGFFILLLFMARHIVLPFIFGLLVAYILNPLVTWLAIGASGKRRLSRASAIILCYVLILSSLGVFSGMLLPRLSSDVARVAKEAPEFYARINNTWVPQAAQWLSATFPSIADSSPDILSDVPNPDPLIPPGTQLLVTPLADGRLAIHLDGMGLKVQPASGGAFIIRPQTEENSPNNLETRLRHYTKSLLSGLKNQIGQIFVFGQTLVTKTVQGIFNFFLVLMIAAFLLIDVKRIGNFARGLVPTPYQKDFDSIETGFNRGLNGVIRGQLVICLVNGGLTWIGLTIFEVKYAFLLAVVATLLSLIPIFGSILSTLPIVLAALVSGLEGVDMWRALMVLLWIIGIHLIEANILNPRIMGDATHIHPVGVIFALVLGEHYYGLTGALLAVPVASMVQFLFIFSRDKAWRSEQPASVPAAGSA